MRIKSTHFIDTSILASLVFNDQYANECIRYVRRISRIYNGKISLLVLGELYQSLLEGVSNNIDRTGAFQDINGIIESLDFSYVNLKLTDYIHCIRKIQEAERRIRTSESPCHDRKSPSSSPSSALRTSLRRSSPDPAVF